MQTDLCTCNNCKKLTNHIIGGLCSYCFGEQEEQFQKVKDFLRKHKNATVLQISKECNVSQLKIDKWLREGRLEPASNSPIKIQCKSCGTVIDTGNLCDKCKIQMNSLAYSLKTGAELPKQHEEDNLTKRLKETQARMRFLQKFV